MEKAKHIIIKNIKGTDLIFAAIMAVAFFMLLMAFK